MLHKRRRYIIRMVAQTVCDILKNLIDKTIELIETCTDSSAYESAHCLILFYLGNSYHLL